MESQLLLRTLRISPELCHDCEQDMKITKEILHKILEISRSGR